MATTPVITVEMGSTSSKNRRPGHTYMVQIATERGFVIVAIGLTQGIATRLADQMRFVIGED